MGGVTMNLFICYSKCSTCKKAKVFLDKENFLYQERDIKEQNPTFEELKKWHEKGIPLKIIYVQILYLLKKIISNMEIDMDVYYT